MGKDCSRDKAHLLHLRRLYHKNQIGSKLESELDYYR